MTEQAGTLASIHRHLSEQGWDVFPVEGAPAVQAAARGESGEWYCQAWWLADVERFVFYSICPVPMPLDRCDEAMRFLTRVNLGLSAGNFELDLDDGGVRMKTSVVVAPEAISADLVERQAETNIATMDHFLPGLLRVAFGEADPDVEAGVAFEASIGQ